MFSGRMTNLPMSVTECCVFSGRMINLMDEGMLTLQDGEEFTRWITKEGCFKSRKSHVKGVRIGKSGRQSQNTQFHMLT